MCQVKPIQVNHYRQQNSPVFTNAKATQDIIDNVLPILSKYLNPPGITDSHGIRVVTPDTQW
jgi:hypothetical protein